MSVVPATLYRTDHLPHHMNAGKEAQVHALLAAWRRAACTQAREQWRLIFTAGAPNKHHTVHPGATPLNAAYVQMVRWQVVGQLESFLSNRVNDFRSLVNHSSLPADIRHQLHFINKSRAWYAPRVLTMRDGTAIAPDVRRLAQHLMRHLLKRHRQPDFSRAAMMIDQRRIVVARGVKARHFSHWARLSTLTKGKRIEVPLQSYDYFEQRKGRLAASVQVFERDGELVFGLMTDVTEAFAASRDTYRPRTEALALDLGLTTLFATDQGDLLGQRWLARLRAYDARITKLAAYRQSHGMKPRSERYKRYVRRLRGFIQSEVGRILNRLVDTHAPAEIVVEHLRFHSPNLSRRLNRLLSLFGKATVQAKLQDLREQFGIEITEVHAAYSSQEHAACGYVDKKNRPRQAEFGCRWCGKVMHADVNAARSLLARRSDPAIGSVKRQKQTILGELVRRFTLRYARARGGAPDPRLKNPYFKDWSAAVTSTGFSTS